MGLIFWLNPNTRVYSLPSTLCWSVFSLIQDWLIGVIFVSSLLILNFTYHELGGVESKSLKLGFHFINILFQVATDVSVWFSLYLIYG